MCFNTLRAISSDHKVDMEIYESNRKYILPLDSEDLSFLPLLIASPKPNNDIMPLWSRNNLKQRDEDCYYEFEVKSEQDISNNETYISSTDTSSYSEANVEISTNFCFICNLKVPLPYTRAHTDSPKHKTFLKIAEIALERVKKQISQNNATENPIPSMYFCETCIVVVPIRDKPLHVKSKAHKNAKLLDKLLEDLLTLYSDEALENDIHNQFETESHCDESDKNINKTVKANVIKKRNDVESNRASVETSVKLINETETANKIVYNQKTVKAFENGNKKFKINDDTNATEYFNIINSFTVSTHKLQDINGQYLMIETINGKQLKVKHDSFHGIVPIGERHYQCKICVEIIKNKKEHIYSTAHMEKISLPIIDEQCIRELGDTKNHCILCNDFIENPDVHIHNNEIHKAQLKNAILTIDNIEKQREEMMTVLGPTKKTKNDKRNDSVLENKGVPYVADLKSKNSPVEKENKKPSKILEIDSVVKASDNNTDSSERKELFCSVCYIKIQANDLQSHAISEKHKYNEKLDFHYLLKYDSATNKVKCKICNSFVHPNLINDHVKNPDHFNNYKALLAANKMEKNKKNVHCEACTVYMRIGNELLHIASTKHCMQLTKPKDVIFDNIVIDSCNENIHYCDVCQVKVPNNTHNIDTHYNGKSHKKKFELQKNVTVPGNGKSVQADKNTDVKLSNASKSNETKVAVEISKIREKINSSSILKETEKKVAKGIISPAELLAAKLQPKNAITNMPVAIGKAIIDVNKELKKSNPITQETDGNDNKKSIFTCEETDIMEITSNPKELMCKICNVIISNKTMNITEHLIGYNHANNIKVLMKENQLKLTGNLFFCNSCREYVTIKDQFNHINKDSHVANVTKTVTNMMTSDSPSFIKSKTSDSGTITVSASDKINIVQSSPQSSIDIQSNSVKSQQNTHTYFEFKLTEAPYELLCEVCNVKVPNSVSTLNMHIGGNKHNSLLRQILLKNKIKEENGNIECTVCFMELTKLGILNHIKKKYHITCLEKNGSNSIENNYCNVCNTTVDNDKIEEHRLSTQHLTNEKEIEQLKNNVCEICDIQLTNNVLNINEHNNGLQHKNNIKLMEANNIEIRENKCYCRSCDEEINYKSMQEHIRTSRHLMLTGSDDLQ